MDEKKFELFSKAWLFLGQKSCEKYGARADLRVVFADAKKESEKEEES